MLEALIEAGDFEIQTVYTMPDKPTGRKQELQKSPVKILAEKHKLKIKQPTSLKNLQSSIFNLQLNIVCDYGLIIPENILNTPTYGSINIHPSLLPKYRGATPIQSTLINGELETGVSVMLMDEKMDHGPILAQKTIEIDIEDNYTSLHEKLAKTAKNLLPETIFGYLAGEITPKTQNHSEATFCKEFKKEDGKINWDKSALEIYNQWRGMIEWPGVWTELKSKRLKIIKLKLTELFAHSYELDQGEIKVDKDKIFVGCGDKKLIEIQELQLEGKKVMGAKEFINGNQNLDKATLSS